MQLQCPIFNEDKYAYIEKMPEFFLDTLKIELYDDEDIQREYLEKEKHRIIS